MRTPFRLGRLRKSLFYSFVFTGCLFASSCGTVSNFSEEEEWPEVPLLTAYQRVQKFGPIVATYQAEDVYRLYRALHLTTHLRFAPSRSGASPFQKLFGTGNLSAPSNYIAARTNGWLFDKKAADALHLPSEAFAVNIGPTLWLLAVGAPAAVKPIEQAFKLPVARMKQGFFYIRKDEGVLNELSQHLQPILDFSVLVHEARHSDCTTKMTPALLKKIKSSPQNLPAECFHAHVACTSGDKGLPKDQCDSDFGGPYAIGYAVLEDLAERCEGCAIPSKFILKMSAIEYLRHVNSLPPGLRVKITTLLEKVHDLFKPGFSNPGIALRESFDEMDALTLEINTVLVRADDFRF